MFELFHICGVLCFETLFRIQFMREIFWYLKIWKFLKKIKMFEKKEIFEKRFLNCLRKHFYLANYCLVSPYKFTRCNLPINIVHPVVFFVSIILKILLYNINDKRPTNYKMRCKLRTGFCSRFQEQFNTLSCLFFFFFFF